MDCLEMVYAGSAWIFLSVQQYSLLDKLDPCSATSLPWRSQHWRPCTLLQSTPCEQVSLMINQYRLQQIITLQYPSVSLSVKCV